MPPFSHLALLPILALGALLTVSACAAAPHGAHSDRAWVWILTGPRDAEVQGNERRAAFAGHFANMASLAAEGELLLAGPFGEPLAQADHRGIFVLATSDLGAASAIAASDPTTRAGVFRLEVEPFRSDDALDRLPELHMAAVAAEGVVDPPPGYHCRSYVLVTGRPAAAAERALDAAPVLFAGRLGAGADERALACLDATTAEEARAQLPGETDDGDVRWTVMPWFATEEIANLRAR